MTIEVFAAGKTEVARNIKEGQSALARAKTMIVTPGVKIDVAPGVPLFHADPDRPDRLVRVLDKKVEYGRFVNGKFRKTGR